MNLYIPKDLFQYLDDNKGDMSRESLLLKMAYYSMENVSIENVKKRGKNETTLKGNKIQE